ncbi:MAG: GyrI-like domain-containing protein [Clostridia bacterium]|nr:GyrI-like domain-containing protein [Clostridia bacterium]
MEAVEEFGKESENIKFKIIPETKAISVDHKGPYSKLRDVYAFALNYTKEKGCTIADKPREVYVNGCWDCESEEDYLTRIQIPIK